MCFFSLIMTAGRNGSGPASLTMNQFMLHCNVGNYVEVAMHHAIYQWM